MCLGVKFRRGGFALDTMNNSCFCNIYPAKPNVVISMMFTYAVFLICVAGERPGKQMALLDQVAICGGNIDLKQVRTWPFQYALWFGT